MDPVVTYENISIQAQDAQVGDLLFIPEFKIGFPILGSHKDPRMEKPFWVLVINNQGEVEHTIHNQNALVDIVRPNYEDQGEFEDEDCDGE